jgi:hypothetical protein
MWTWAKPSGPILAVAALLMGCGSNATEPGDVTTTSGLAARVGLPSASDTTVYPVAVCESGNSSPELCHGLSVEASASGSPDHAYRAHLFHYLVFWQDENGVELMARSGDFRTPPLGGVYILNFLLKGLNQFPIWMEEGQPPVAGVPEGWELYLETLYTGKQWAIGVFARPPGSGKKAASSGSTNP